MAKLLYLQSRYKIEVEWLLSNAFRLFWEHKKARNPEPLKYGIMPNIRVSKRREMYSSTFRKALQNK